MSCGGAPVFSPLLSFLAFLLWQGERQIPRRLVLSSAGKCGPLIPPVHLPPSMFSVSCFLGKGPSRAFAGNGSPCSSFLGFLLQFRPGEKEKVFDGLAGNGSHFLLFKEK